jgi:formate--tetrahydrofolate ligase
VSREYLENKKKSKHGKLILVAGITPTKAGEGKTATSVGLGDGLSRIGKKKRYMFKRAIFGTMFWYERWSGRTRAVSSYSDGGN